MTKMIIILYVKCPNLVAINLVMLHTLYQGCMAFGFQTGKFLRSLKIKLCKMCDPGGVTFAPGPFIE